MDENENFMYKGILLLKQMDSGYLHPYFEIISPQRSIIWGYLLAPTSTQNDFLRILASSNTNFLNHAPIYRFKTPKSANFKSINTNEDYLKLVLTHTPQKPYNRAINYDFYYT